MSNPPGLSAIESRVAALEQWKNAQTTAQAVDGERRKYMETRFNELEKRLDRIDGHISKVVWIVISAIGMGFMAFVVSGGLNVIR
ncbi:hypothetical protein [Mesorhizobium sp. Z1-4]|uniref:hypothetical protein n=1 Tax=Mesorhizobium sp. Z1-4 TaxID=2448478 RepID=UPI000FDB7643|nr:hypothetical protein [Mesorhizobium sp. Z1-4]